MQARHRFTGIKTHIYRSNPYEINEFWTVVEEIGLFLELSRYPLVYDCKSAFDIKPFKRYEDSIKIRNNLVYTSNDNTVAKLLKFNNVVKQAFVKDTNTHILRILDYNTNPLKFNEISNVDVLIFRSVGGLGDIVMTLPVAEAIKKVYPQYKITYACQPNYLPLVENNPFIDSCVPLNKLKDTDWKAIIDLSTDCIKYEISNQPNVMYSRSEVFLRSAGLGIKCPRPKIYLTSNEILWAKKYLGISNKIKIGIIPEANAGVRRWGGFSKLSSKLMDYNCDIFEITKDDSGDRILNNRVRNIYGLNLRQLSAVLNEMDVVVSADTGPAHIASALRVPTVWIFTHIDGKVRTKNYDQDFIKVVQKTSKDCPYGRPCWYDIPCGNGEKMEDPFCSTCISVEDVLKEVVNFMNFPSLTYCVVGHDRTKITKECLDRIYWYKKFNEEVIYLDNGSSESLGFLDKYKGLNIIYNKSNAGCILARNKAMKVAKGVLLLTPDNDQYISENTVHSLKMFEEDIVGVEGWSMNEEGYATRIEKKKGPLVYVGAGAMLVKKKVAENIGYFSEEYAPAWFEDPDFCLKAREAGYKINFDIDANVSHLGHQTVSSQKTFDKMEAWKNSREVFLKKWKGNINKILRHLVSIYVDVPGWAWDFKAKQIFKYLIDEFDFNIMYSFIPSESKLNFTFECETRFIKYYDKYITGVTAHTYKNFKDFEKNLRNAVAVHANSIMLYDEIKQINTNCFYVPNGVDTDEFPYYRRNIKESFTIGYVGKDNSSKGYNDFIVPACQKAGVKLKSQLARFNSKDKVDHKDMHLFYRDVDAIIVASEMDGTPNQLLEAASVGRTFIGNRIGNIPEFVIQNVNGIMVEKNIDAYVEAINYLRRDREQCEHMGQSARATVLKGWTWEKQAENYRNMFREVLKIL